MAWTITLSGGQLLDLCASLPIMNTVFKQKVVDKTRWHQDNTGCMGTIRFVIASDLLPHVLDTQVKRGAELSTEHHQVIF